MCQTVQAASEWGRGEGSWRSQKFGSFALLGFAFNRFLCELATNVNSLQTHTDTHTHTCIYIQPDWAADTVTELKIQIHLHSAGKFEAAAK